MALNVENTTGAVLAVNDLGITMQIGQIVDLELVEDAHTIAVSANGGDLESLITATSLSVKDPIDGTTALSVADGLAACRTMNETHWRMPSAARLGDISDVDASGLADNFVLQYNNGTGNYEVVSVSTLGSDLALNDLSDVDAGSPADNQVIAFNTGSGNWEAANVNTLGAGILGLGEWRYETATVAPPSSGRIRFNNADITLATTLWVHYDNFSGDDLQNFLSALTAGSVIYAQDLTDSTHGFVCEVVTFTDQTTYAEYAITNVVLLGTALAANDRLGIFATGGGAGGGTGDAITDADGDTRVRVEASADEDVIRFDVGDTPAGFNAVSNILTLAANDVTLFPGVAGTGTTGAPVNILAGFGGASGGTGGTLALTGGLGGTGSGDGGPITLTGGQSNGGVGGDIDINGGFATSGTNVDGGNVNIFGGNSNATGGDGGNVVLGPGNGDQDGFIILSATQAGAAPELHFEDDAGGQYIGFVAPSVISTSFTLTWPSTDSTGTQALVSDGAGTLSWQTVAGDPDQNLWLTITSDSGSTSADTTTDTLTVAGGTGIDTSISGDTLTVAVDAGGIDHGSLAGLGDNDHPQYVLDAGDTMTGQLLMHDGSGAAPSIAFSSEPDTGIYLSGTDTFGISTNGAGKFFVANTEITSAITHWFQNGTEATPSIAFATDNDTGLFHPAADTIGFSTGNSEAARFDSGGLQLGATHNTIDVEFSTAGADLILQAGDAGVTPNGSDVRLVPGVTATSNNGEVVIESPAGGGLNAPALAFRENVLNGTNAIKLRAPNTVASDVTFVLPGADGTAGQVLVTDGFARLDWADNAASDLAGVTVTNTTGSAIPTTYGDVTWDTTDFENDAATVEHNNTNTDNIDIKETGTYIIFYNISFDADAGEETIEARVRVNDTTVLAASERLASEDDEINDLSNSFLVNLTDGDFVTLQVQASGTGNVLHQSSNFSVVRARGAKGDTGPAGTGSTINVEDDGVNVGGGPHDTINVIGPGLTATDAGGGTAEIVGSHRYLFRHNDATTQTYTAVTTINVGTSVRQDTGYSHAIVGGGSEITVTNAGWYEISFTVTATSSGARITTRNHLEVNTVEVPGSVIWGYHRNTANGENSVSTTVLVNLSASDVIRIRSEASASVDTVADGCNLRIRTIDAP